MNKCLWKHLPNQHTTLGLLKSSDWNIIFRPMKLFCWLMDLRLYHMLLNQNFHRMLLGLMLGGGKCNIYDSRSTSSSFEVEKKFWDLENILNQSLVPRRSQAFEENHKLKKKQPENPLKQLLIKQRKESWTGYPIIKGILSETNFYTITLK